jgi:hypothetical protein
LRSRISFSLDDGNFEHVFNFNWNDIYSKEKKNISSQSESSLTLGEDLPEGRMCRFDFFGCLFIRKLIPCAALWIEVEPHWTRSLDVWTDRHKNELRFYFASFCMENMKFKQSYSRSREYQLFCGALFKFYLTWDWETVTTLDKIQGCWFTQLPITQHSRMHQCLHVHVHVPNSALTW